MSVPTPRLPLALCALLPALLAPGVARAADLHVAPAGSDAALGTAAQPLATIGRAAALAKSGDVVLVAGGRYRESVTVTRPGITFRAEDGARPVIDGEGTRDFGFTSGTKAVDGTTVSGFELTGQGEAAISLQGSRVTVSGNRIHDVGADGRMLAYGVHVSYGTGVRVSGNEIESIGPGGQATGVLMTTLRESTVDGNQIRLVRKEGIRDSWGLDNVMRDNTISLCWTAISFNTSTGTVAANNYVHDNVQGFNPKHLSEPRVIDYWKLDAPHWSRFEHNTVYRSSDSSLAIAINAPELDYLAIRDNVLSGAGGSFIADAPDVRGDHIAVDGNLYSAAGGAPAWAYHHGYDFKTDGLAGLADLRSSLGWDRGGRWDDRATPRTAGVSPALDALPDAGGAGASGLAPEAVTWTPLPMKPIHSTSPGTWYTRQHLADTSDGVHHTYWLSSTDQNESVTFDFGSAQTFQQLLLDVYAQDDKRNVHGYRFEVSDDDVTYRTVLAGQNPDTYGSSYKYELPAPVTARYLRFVLVDTVCDSYAPRTGCGEYFVLSDLTAGMLAPRVDPPAPAPTVPAAASPAPVSATAAPTVTPAPKKTSPATATPAPDDTAHLRSAKRTRRGVRVVVACDAPSCRGRVTVRKARGRRALARKAFVVARGTHAFTVRVSRSGPGFNKLRAVLQPAGS